MAVHVNAGIDQNQLVLTVVKVSFTGPVPSFDVGKVNRCGCAPTGDVAPRVLRAVLPGPQVAPLHLRVRRVAVVVPEAAVLEPDGGLSTELIDDDPVGGCTASRRGSD